VKREEFENQAVAAAGPDLRGSDHLKASIYDIGRRGGPFYHSDVVDVLQEAERRREDATSSQDGKAPRRSPRPKPGAEAHVLSRVLVDGLRPWTEGLRHEGFGSPSAPYPDDEGAAADYIEETSASDLVRWRGAGSDNSADEEQLYRLAHQLGVDVASRARHLPYGRPGDNFQKNAPVFPGTFLFKLAGEIAKVSRQTGLSPEALTAHVLTDVEPLMPRVRRINHDNYFRLPSGKLAHLRSVTLTFRTTDLTFEELRALYDDIKSYMGGAGVQAPTLEDFEFWQLVEEMGGPPEPYQGVRNFWQDVLKKWNQQHPNDTPLKSWEGLQKRHRRICKRLGIR
jgi:hypothetical protein